MYFFQFFLVLWVIGIALKGLETKDLKRGYVFSDKEINSTNKLSIEFKKNKFSKFEIKQGRKLMVCTGLQVLTAEIKNVSGDKLELELESLLAVYKKDCILATTDSSPRIIGSGKIA